MTVQPFTVVCTRCAGLSPESWAMPGYGTCCVPNPGEPADALRGPESPPAGVPTPPGASATLWRRSSPTDAAATPPPTTAPTGWVWLAGVDPRTIAHLFELFGNRSSCGKVDRTSACMPAPPGVRGCRPCARSRNLIATVHDRVTT